MDAKNDGALFLMAQPSTFTWPVEVRIPLNGRYGLVSFVGEFPNLSEADSSALVASNDDGTPKHSNAYVADRVLVGFSKVEQPDGTFMPFTAENKAALLAIPRVAPAVVGTFLAVTRGMAAEKNV